MVALGELGPAGPEPGAEGVRPGPGKGPVALIADPRFHDQWFGGVMVAGPFP